MKSDHWAGLARETIERIGDKYEAACQQAMTIAGERHPDDTDAFTEEFVLLRKGIRHALADELLQLGCPEAELGEWGAMVVNCAVHRRRQSTPALAPSIH